MRGIERDLLGRRQRTKRPDYEAALEKRDLETLPERAARVRWLRRHLPRGGMLLPPDSMFVFEEAKAAFVSGHFISTILLSGGFAEHWMTGALAAKGFAKEIKPGLRACIACARKIEAWPNFVLDELDRIQDVRNPFVHLKSFGHPHSLSARTFHVGEDVSSVLRCDAEKALSAIFAMIQTTSN